MPGFHIHLSIGNRYIEKHEVKDRKQFLEGIIAPDFEEKEKSHYTIPSTKDNLVEHLKCKVSIENFLKEHTLENDYEKGLLLHLITDKLFFTEFFPKEYLESVDEEHFRKDLYISYDETNDYLEKKYNLQADKELMKKVNDNIKGSREKWRIDREKSNNILPIEKLEAFIEEVSDIDLEQYKR